MKRAGELLSDFFKEHFDQVSLENGRMTAGLISSWAIAVKAANIPAAADHSRIRELEHKVLVIEADHPGWVQLLQTKQSQLLKHVQGRFPELGIQGISFCLSREPVSSVTSTIDKLYPPEGPSAKTQTDVGTPLSEPREGNKVLYEPIKEFRRVIQKRNKSFGKYL